MKTFTKEEMVSSLKKMINEPPGSLSYTGHHKHVPITIEEIWYHGEEKEKSLLQPSEIKPYGEGVQWINITGLHHIDVLKEIQKEFGIHPMDLEDIVHVSQRSKIEQREDYLFSIFKMVYLRGEKIIHEHVSMILKGNTLLTFQETPGDVFTPIRDRIFHGEGQIADRDASYLYYALIDVLIDQYFEIMGHIDGVFLEAERKIIEENSKELDEVYFLRKELLYVRNALLPIQEALTTFVKKDHRHFSLESSPYYEDILDHLKQISDQISAYREMVNSLYEMQMANVSNDMNQVMMTLTIFSAIFIPLSFLAGVFGMNFSHFPGLGLENGFWYFLLACFAIGVGMLSFFKIKKWF